MENKQHRSFLEICQEFVKVSEIATPFLNYDGVEPAINLQKSAHENHLKDLRREALGVLRIVVGAERLEEFRQAQEDLLLKTTPKELREEWKKCVFEDDDWNVTLEDTLNAFEEEWNKRNKKPA